MKSFNFSQVLIHHYYYYIYRYQIQWYIIPINIQKLILILLQRGNKTFGLNIGGLFIASIQCFAMVKFYILIY